MLSDHLDMEGIGETCPESRLSLHYERKKHPDNCHQCRQGIFVEPMKWMGSKNSAFVNGGTATEKILCERCNSKVGAFGWLNSVPCPCGVVMGPPGFFIQMSRVDRCTMVKEVEASI